MDELVVEESGGVLTVTFNRPQRHNAMTFAMYEGLYEACERADADAGVRVLVLRGAGEKAFVSGTDIQQFAGFRTGADGVEYEARIGRVLHRLQDVEVPTVAAVRGYCIGGGLAMAASCDLRIATGSARFGVPIARTLGNCLSGEVYALLAELLGSARTMDMLLRARLLTAEEAGTAGFVGQVCAEDDLDEVLGATLSDLLGHAPLSMWAAKRALTRLRRAAVHHVDTDDIVARVYGSADFQRAVAGFGTQRPTWYGE